MLSLLGEDPLLGPLAQLQGDDFDGPEPETEVDERRFQPRSDDEDTYVALILLFRTTPKAPFSPSPSSGRRKHPQIAYFQRL